MMTKFAVGDKVWQAMVFDAVGCGCEVGDYRATKEDAVADMLGIVAARESFGGASADEYEINSVDDDGAPDSATGTGKGVTLSDMLTDAYQSWCGSDGAPGSRTWGEWERATGKTREQMRSGCCVSERDFATAKHPDDVSRLCDAAWVAQLEEIESEE